MPILIFVPDLLAMGADGDDAPQRFYFRDIIDQSVVFVFQYLIHIYQAKVGLQHVPHPGDELDEILVVGVFLVVQHADGSERLAVRKR